MTDHGESETENKQESESEYEVNESESEYEVSESETEDDFDESETEDDFDESETEDEVEFGGFQAKRGRPPVTRSHTYYHCSECTNKYTTLYFKVGRHKLLLKDFYEEHTLF